jgi:tRNA (cmo5U34)-methyltransferase
MGYFSNRRMPLFCRFRDVASRWRDSMDDHPKDDLFSRPRDAADRFRFDEAVARVFPDMVRRSVPGYEQLVDLTGLIGRRFIRPDTRVYDLGCSLGATTLSLVGQASGERCEFIALDNSPAMVEALAARLRDQGTRGRVHVVCADAGSVAIENASLVVLNLTLQFIAPRRRLALLRRIRRGLVPGGALILSEKIRPSEPAEDRLLRVLHEDFKRANGYSELEISRKRAALERVLIPEDPGRHLQRLQEAGFAHGARWFQCLNFVSFLAWT